MNIIVTGSRAPAALDLMRALHAEGHQVYSADSMRFALSRFSNAATKHIVLPSPNREMTAYITALKDAIIEHQIDILIPTCEEIFFIARFHKELSLYCELFLEPLEKLIPLHNKYQFIKLVKNCGIGRPKTICLQSNEDKKYLPNYDFVLKPVYSRFASHTLIKPTKKQIKRLQITVAYVAQEFIEGKEFCAYCIAKNGKLISYAIYHPQYTAGAAAGIYFKPETLEEIKVFTENLIKKIQFTGQISFDFIEKNQTVYILECNPRATSGLHLIAHHINWGEALQGKVQPLNYTQKPKMLRLAMLSYGLKAFFSKKSKQFVCDYQKADDVLMHRGDGWMHLKSTLAILEIIFRCLRYKKTFKNAATDDIEWNGEPL